MTNGRGTMIVAAVMVAAGFASSCSWAEHANDDAARASAPPSLDWASCPGERNPPDMECATIDVPVDWQKPSGRKITLKMGRLPGTDPSRRMGTVIYHAGGPGPDNLPTLGQYAPNFTDLRARFDVVTWTPRGAAGTWGGQRQAKECDMSGPTFSLPASRAEYDAKAQQNRSTYQRCREVDPELFDHMDSGQHARDLEAIRAALGEHQLNFIGQSYGAVVATTYARFFPERVRTLFVDSTVNHVTSLEDDDAYHYEEAQTLFDTFVDWCAAHTECVLHGKNVREVWRKLIADADRSPVPVAGNPSVRYSGVDMIRTVGAFLSYERFAELSAAIDAARNGDATAITGPARNAPGMKPLVPNSSLATECADGSFYADYEDYEQAVTAGRKLAPDFPAERAAYHSLCIGWPLAAANPRAPITDKKLPPILGAAAAADLLNTRAITDQVPGSTTINVAGVGHGQYMFYGNPCVIEKVNKYFIDRAAPPADTTCPPAPPKPAK